MFKDFLYILLEKLKSKLKIFTEFFSQDKLSLNYWAKVVQHVLKGYNLLLPNHFFDGFERQFPLRLTHLPEHVLVALILL